MTFIGITAGPDGDRPQLTLRSSHLSPRVLSTGPAAARIALVSTTALLLAGDAVEITIDVGPGCRLELVDTAGTVAYDAQGAKSSWTVDIRVAPGGLLLWRAEPLVIADGADVNRTTTVDLATGATACLRETIVLGRSGETGGALLSTLRARLGGSQLLAEDLDLTGTSLRQRPGVLGNHRIIDTVSLLGTRDGAGDRAGDSAGDSAGDRDREDAHSTVGQAGSARYFPLAGPGTLARFLGSDLHRSGIPPVYARWRQELVASRSGDVSVQ